MLKNLVHLSRHLVKPGFFQNITTNKLNSDHIVKRWAGHSKWANIKHTKAINDQNKSKIFQRICKNVYLAVKQDGDNIKLNWKLKALWEEAKRVSMPLSTFENAIKLAKTSEVEKPSWLIYKGPKGIIAGFEVSTQNLKHAQSKINQYAKRIELKIEQHPFDLIREKGIIVCDPIQGVENAYDKATEDAIEFGMEEVVEDDEKMLIFECHPTNVDFAHKKLLEKGYNVHSASTQLEFNNYITLNDEEIKNVNSVIDSIYKNCEILNRVSTNVENLELP